MRRRVGKAAAVCAVGGVLLGLMGGARAAEAESVRLPGHGLPPPAKPQRRAAGESFAPLPLPVTPLRRSEKKRQPAPPALVAKVAYTPVSLRMHDGRVGLQREWLNVTDDVRNLLRWTNHRLGIRYRHLELAWKRFGFDPAEVPVLYLTGHEPIPMPPEPLCGRLRQFVLDGGTILANACCGSREFADSFRRLMVAVFPKRELAPLPSDHPVFKAFYDIQRVRYQKGTNPPVVNAPYLEGLNIGVRTAVFFAPFDLANGWYGQDPPPGYEPGAWIVGEDARRLGSNLIVYILATYSYGRMRAIEKTYYEQAAPSRDRLVVAQLMHNGDWDPTPTGLVNLFKAMREHCTLAVQCKREPVLPASEKIFDYSILYLTGLRDFVLSEQEVANLRADLNQGGLLVADAACGRRVFDVAFRRELARILPEGKLRALPLDHPLYSVVFPIGSVNYTDLVRSEMPELNAPTLEGLEIDGRLAVVYSRFSLGCGWEQFPHPYNRGYAQDDAVRLGVNIFAYGMTH